MSPTNHTINYLELPLADTDATKSFYSSTFGWEFQDWGPDYLSFTGAEVAGGFNRERKPADSGAGPLIVLFSDNLETTQQAANTNGAQISREIYGFPGGRRFHFIDPNGNEVAVWGEAAEESG
ncbi:MAG: VOC family protein [Pirellulaceae bacterium]